MSAIDDFAVTYLCARDGEASARDDLARAFTPDLERYVGQHSGKDVRRRLATEDICQNALLTFFERIAGFPEHLSERDLLAYLLKIARWQIGDVLRRKNVVQGESAAACFEPTVETPTRGPVTKADDRRQVVELIDRLREGYRSVLTCTVLEGLGIVETAEKLDLEPATVRQRVSRARRELRELMTGRSAEDAEGRG